MSVSVHHPETGADLVVTEEQLAHMRIAGWMLRSEWDEFQAAAAARDAAAAAVAQPSKPASKAADK